MKRYRYLLIFLVLSSIIGTAIYFLVQPPNPSYRGRRLSDWLQDLPEIRNPSVPPMAVEAIQTMGTNAIPFLLRELATTDSFIGQKLKEVQQRHNSNFYKAALWRQEQAKAALIVMGEPAKSAIPKLEKLLENEESAENVAFVLLRLSPEVTAVLRKAMTHPDADVRRVVPWALSTPEGTNHAREFLPELLQQLNDSDHYVQNAAIGALKNVAEKHEVIIPALIKCLPINPMATGEALDNFGTNILAYSNQIMELIQNGKVPAEWIQN